MQRRSDCLPASWAMALLLAAMLPVSAARAQPPGPGKPGDLQIDRFLAREAERLGRRVFDGATTREEWEAKRPRLRQELLDMLGLWPLPEKTALHDRVTGTVERDGGVVIEMLHFQSRPGLYVTGNLYRPKEARGKLPAVLYVCGHSGRGRDGNKTAFQDHGMWFARNGYVCLLIDTLQLGEVAGVHHGTYNLGRFWWQAAGYTPAGVECWNGIRAIDYLSGRPDVDAGRIAVTGISGGGATTFWIAAADERVRCAVPVSGMSDLESYVDHKVVDGHCDCMFCINTYGWEWTTIAALIAPRPLLFANSDEDPIFPMDGNRRVIDRLRRLYDLYGQPDKVAEHVSHGGHAYRPDLRKAVFGWINRHLKDDPGPVRDAEDPPIDGKRLRTFPEDKDLPADSRNATIDETFVAGARVEVPAKDEDFPAWKEEMVKKLRKGPFRRFPERIPAAEPRRTVDEAGSVRMLATEPGIEVAVKELKAEGPKPGPGTLIVLNPGEGLVEGPLTRLGASDDDGRVVLLAPRGVGPTEWTRRSPPNYVERAHALLGRTVDDGRVWDIAATVRWLAEESGGKTKWRVAGSRQSAVLAAYAGLFEPTVAGVFAADPTASHRDGPFFLGVLRVLDVPEALGLLAPTPLTLFEARGPFSRTQSLYDKAGAPLLRGETPKPEPFFRSVAIFPKEDKHNHASSVIELANGDLLAAWYRGTGERTADDVEIQGAWLKAGTTSWGPRFLLADTPGYPDCNPALFAAPDRTIWLFWPTILDHRWEGALLKFAVARDDGGHSGPPRWTRGGVLHVTPKGFAPAMERAIRALPDTVKEAARPALDRLAARSKDELYQRLGWMPRVHPTVLPSGRWLLPLYSDTFDASIVATSDDRGSSWSVGEPMLGFGSIQPSLVRKSDGEVVAFMRDNGPHRRIRLSTSGDEGRSWSPVVDSPLPNPGAGIEAIRLANGHWALVYNDSERGRHSLALSISDDEGASWKWTRHIEARGAGEGQFHYPSILQARDGVIHVTYTRRLKSEGSTIQHAAFNEEWVVEGDTHRGR